MVVAFGFITCNDAIMKWVIADMHLIEAILIRGAFSLLFILTLVFATGRLNELRWGNPWAQIAVASSLTVSLFCFITSLQYLPLAIAVTMMSVSPLFTTLLAPFVLGERVGWWRRCAVALGFCGTALVMQPGSDSFHWAVFLPLFGGSLEAVRELITRRVIGGENPSSMTLTAMSFITVAAGVSAPFVWEAPAAHHVGLLALSAACFSIGLLLIFTAIKTADVSVVSPFKYSGVIWATILGFLLWSEVPSLPAIIGAMLIVTGGIIIVRRERMLKKAARQSASG